MIGEKRYNWITIEAVDYALLGFGEDLKHAFYCHFSSSYRFKCEDIPHRLRDFQEALQDSLGTGAKIVERLIAQNIYSRIGLKFTEHGDWRLVDYVKNAIEKGVVRIAVSAQHMRLPGHIALILCLERQYAGCCRPLLLICVLITISCSAIFVGTVRAAPTTYFPSSSNILIGSYVGGDMTSLVNADSNYYVVRSASSATTTLQYNPSGCNLLGFTLLVSGAVSDLASNNGVHMTFRSYASQTSTTSLSRASIGYRSTTGTSSSYPKTRNWDGSAWDGTETELPTAGSPVRWVRIAYSPLVAKYYEKIIVTLSDDGYLGAYVWTGSSWSITNDVGFVGTTANAYRPFDIAYEKTKGRAILVYGISSPDPAKDLAYRIWDGFSWSAESYIDDSGLASDVQYYWVALASKPTSGTNEISLIALEGTTSAGSVRAWIWNGASWGNELGLEMDTIKPREDIAVAYETLSGNAMFVWGDDLANRYDSQRWLGSAWEGIERIAMGPISGDPGWITLKSDPASNRIMLLSVDIVNDLRTSDWNPTTWTVHALHDDTVDYGSQRCADGDWEPTGSKYLMVYGTTAEFVEWKTWTSASGWSTSSSVAAASTHRWVQLRRNQRDVVGDVKILGSMLNNNVDLGAMKWDGATLTNIGNSTFTTDTGTTSYECFDVRFQVFGDPIEFTSETEFTGSSNNYDWTQLVWTVDSAWAESSVTVTIQLYNYNTASYPSSGDGYMSYTSSATPNTDETRTQTITINPQNFKDGSGNWKIKIKGVKTTSTTFDFKIDWIEYKSTYYSEYTASTEFIFSGVASDTLILLVFRAVSQYDIGSVSITIQVWNYNTGQYVTSGEGYLRYVSSATPSADETTILAITTNPSYYVSSGNAKIKITGVKATNTQFQQKANQIKLERYSPITTTVVSTIPTTSVLTITGLTTLTIMGIEHTTHTVILIASTTTSATVTLLTTTTATVTTSTTSSTSTTTTGTTTLVTTTTETFTPALWSRCVIASVAHGSELAPEVQFFRVFRNQFVGSTFAGSAFMKAFNAFYYSFSPAVASVVAQSPLLLQMVRLLLYPLMAVLHVASAIFYALIFAPELATIVSGTVVSALVGVAYLSPLAAVMKIPARRGRRRNWK